MSPLSIGINNARVCSTMAVVFAFCLTSFAAAQQRTEQTEQAEPVEQVAVVKTEAATPTVTLDVLLGKYRERGQKKWEQKIQALEARNVKEGAWPAESLLFFGSSSIRRWETMNNDMVHFPSINRGYGGAKYVDMVLFAERMFTPHDYRALVMFAGNDVKGEDADSSPEEVDCAVREIIRVSKAHRPNAAIFLIEVTPTESRFDVWHKTREVNDTLREIALTTDNTFFIATAQHYLKPNGTPKQEWFVEDKLHLNEQGYKKWAELIKVQLNYFLPAMKK